MKEPKVSIIIVNHNGALFLTSCIRSLLRTEYDNYEILVVDNNSKDGSIEALQKEFSGEPKLSVIRSELNLFYSGGNNLGIRQSTGKYMMILNNDTTVEPNWLNDIVPYMERHQDVAIAQCRLRFMDDPSRLDTTGSFYSKLGFLVITGDDVPEKDAYPTSREVFSAKGAAMMVNRRALEVVGLFDSDFKTLNEDADLCWRSWLMGFRVVYFPGSIVYHKGGGTINKQYGSGGYSRLMMREGSRNYLRMNIKNLGARNLSILVPHLFSWLLLSVFLTFRRNRMTILVFEGIYLALGRDLSSTLTKRREIQRDRKVPDKVVFSKLSVAYPLSEIIRRFRVVGRWKS